jgi:signal transduction histidine kinase
METIGRLAGGVAHDFNNLLVGIMGGTSLALDELPESHPARTHLELVLRSSERAAELIRQLLAYSGKGRLFKSRVDLAAAIHQACASIRSRIARSVKLIIECDPGLPSFLADGE